MATKQNFELENQSDEANWFNMSFEDPGRQMSSMVTQLSTAIPDNMIIREAVMNAIEAIQRFLASIEDHEDRERFKQNARVYIERDHQFKNKLSVINICGDYLSTEKAKKHLVTVSNSGNSENDSGQAENFGIGAKVAYVPYNSEGLYYRSKDSDEEYGIRFTFKKNPKNGQFGCPAEWDEFEEHLTNFITCSEFHPKLTKAIPGTEMVCMGNSDSDDTFEKLDRLCSILGKSGGTGNGILLYLNTRVWESWGSPIKVRNYTADGVASGHYLTVCPLKETMLKSELNGHIILNNEVGVPNGTKAYYCKVPKWDDNKTVGDLSSGFTGFAWKKETYSNRYSHQHTRASQLRQAGIFNDPLRWLIIFELPDGQQFFPNMQRTTLKQLELEGFLTAFKKNMPQEVEDDLYSQIDEQSSKDLNSWLKDHFKDLKVTSSPLQIAGSQSSNDTTGQNNSGSPRSKKIAEYQGSKQKPSASKRLKSLDPPEVQIVENPDDPLAVFDYSSDYRIVINRGADLYQWRFNLCRKEINPSVLDSEIREEIDRYFSASVIEWVFEVHSTWPNATEEEKIKKFEHERLEACSWCKTKVLTNLRRKQNNRKAA